MHPLAANLRSTSAQRRRRRHHDNDDEDGATVLNRWREQVSTMESRENRFGSDMKRLVSLCLGMSSGAEEAPPGPPRTPVRPQSTTAAAGHGSFKDDDVVIVAEPWDRGSPGPVSPNVASAEELKARLPPAVTRSAACARGSLLGHNQRAGRARH